MLTVRIMNTAGTMSMETVKATGRRTGIGYARTGTMDRPLHRTLQGMDAMAETAIMADAAAVHITDRKNSTAPGSIGHMERLCGRNQM